MKTKFKVILLIGLFFCGFVINMQAQDKYEYAIIDYIPYHGTIEISINGISYQKINIPKGKIKGIGDMNVALEEVNKMTEEGWELFDVAIGSGSDVRYNKYVFYLRRKK